MHIGAGGGTPKPALISNHLPPPILEQAATLKELCYHIPLGNTGLNKGDLVS